MGRGSYQYTEIPKSFYIYIIVNACFCALYVFGYLWMSLCTIAMMFSSLMVYGILFAEQDRNAYTSNIFVENYGRFLFQCRLYFFFAIILGLFYFGEILFPLIASNKDFALAIGCDRPYEGGVVTSLVSVINIIFAVVFLFKIIPLPHRNLSDLGESILPGYEEFADDKSSIKYYLGLVAFLLISTSLFYYFVGIQHSPSKAQVEIAKSQIDKDIEMNKSKYHLYGENYFTYPLLLQGQITRLNNLTSNKAIVGEKREANLWTWIAYSEILSDELRYDIELKELSSQLVNYGYSIIEDSTYNYKADLVKHTSTLNLKLTEFNAYVKSKKEKEKAEQLKRLQNARKLAAEYRALDARSSKVTVNIYVGEHAYMSIYSKDYGYHSFWRGDNKNGEYKLKRGTYEILIGGNDGHWGLAHTYKQQKKQVYIGKSCSITTFGTRLSVENYY